MMYVCGIKKTAEMLISRYLGVAPYWHVHCKYLFNYLNGFMPVDDNGVYLNGNYLEKLFKRGQL